MADTGAARHGALHRHGRRDAALDEHRLAASHYLNGKLPYVDTDNGSNATLTGHAGRLVGRRLQLRTAEATGLLLLTPALGRPATPSR